MLHRDDLTLVMMPSLNVNALQEQAHPDSGVWEGLGYGNRLWERPTSVSLLCAVF